MRTMPSLLIALLVFGVIFRLWPIFFGMPSLGYFFLTEDGYLMLTVARNFALGLGLSVSNGEIATNGVQPLATFLYSTPYYLSEANKTQALLGIHLISALVSLMGAYAIYRFARLMLADEQHTSRYAALAAVIWFLSPVMLRHTMNGLETGLYSLFVFLLLVLFHINVLSKLDPPKTQHYILIGLCAGLCVLARNDAVFLVSAVFIIWLMWNVLVFRLGLKKSAIKLILPGLISILVASPWLLFNKFNFGSIVPISGTAQSVDAEFGENLVFVPAKLLEYLIPAMPLPRSIETEQLTIYVAATVLVFVHLVFFHWLKKRGNAVQIALTGVYIIYATLLVAYYGLFFGAAHFLSRYFSPLAPILLVIGMISLKHLNDFIFRSSSNRTVNLYVAVSLILCIALNLRTLITDEVEQGHQQVTSWVANNVESSEWVGAVQTGTLGYWHDRTINLDGKVNPEALSTKIQDGHVLGYVLESEIQYIVDWFGISEWVTSTLPGADGFTSNFELHYSDAIKNIAVLKRIEE